MGNYSYLHFVFTILAAFAVATQALSKDTITWVRHDAPPFEIMSGSDKSDGSSTQIRKHVIEQLPQHEHKFLDANINRVIHLVQRSSGVTCHTSGHYDVDIKGVISSIPTIVHDSQQVLLLKETYKKIGSPKSISIKTILQNKKLIMGTSSGRKYSPHIDKYIEQKLNQKAPNVLNRAASDIMGLIKILKIGRIDYMIEYEVLADYNIKNYNYSLSDFVKVPIKEHKGYHVVQAFWCSDNKAGKKALASINNALIKIRGTKPYRAIATKWFVKKGEEKEYWNIYKNKVLDVTK